MPRALALRSTLSRERTAVDIVESSRDSAISLLVEFRSAMELLGRFGNR